MSRVLQGTMIPRPLPQPVVMALSQVRVSRPGLRAQSLRKTHFLQLPDRQGCSSAGSRLEFSLLPPLPGILCSLREQRLHNYRSCFQSRSGLLAFRFPTLQTHHPLCRATAICISHVFCLHRFSLRLEMEKVNRWLNRSPFPVPQGSSVRDRVLKA